LLLPAKILLFPEEKENLCKKITKCYALEKLTAKRRNKYNEIWRNQKKCLHLQRHNLINGYVLHKEKRHKCFVYWLVET
jgi:flagellar biosynthesis/type III secretory pathway chaperone